jgi:hypothetical protein
VVVAGHRFCSGSVWWLGPERGAVGNEWPPSNVTLLVANGCLQLRNPELIEAFFTMGGLGRVARCCGVVFVTGVVGRAVVVRDFRDQNEH